jgi:eukaryotic-like serine/threonine-protein kinase
VSDDSSYSWQPPAAAEIADLIPRYKVLELSAIGGLSSVYRVRQENLERDLALKLLRRGGPPTGEWATRFRKEALIMSRLKHATIPTVYDFGQVGEDWFVVMEFIEGISLHVGHYTSGWDFTDVKEFLAEAAHGLHQLHLDGVVHGDIKPDNIMVTPEHLVKIIDFGTACTPGERKLVTDFRGPRQLTAGFAAPELYNQHSAVDARADVYGLGACLLQFVLGEAPPEAFEDCQIAINRLPRAQRKFFQRVMHLQRDERPDDCLAFARELNQLPLSGPVLVNLPETPAAKTTGQQLWGFLRAKWTALVG